MSVWWLLAAAVGSGAAPASAEGLTDGLVREAAQAIVDELSARKDPDRFWEPPRWDAQHDGQKSQRGGYTPLVVLALLHAGVSYQDPRLRDAVDHLESLELDGTYAVAVRAHVWAHLPQKFRARLVGDADWLTAAFQPHVRGWGYTSRPRSGWYDNSLAQYGVLGLWEAAKRGVPVADRYWADVERRFLDNQHPGGGWSYQDNRPVTGSMTAAGLTALFITQDLLHAGEAVDLDRAGPRPYEQAIERGLAWMNQQFTAAENPGRDTYFFYYLYGVERVGLASGYRSFGGRDWFRLGSAEIISRLCERDPATGRLVARGFTGDLAFGLMFLSRGRVPVAINKLRVPGAAWNNRPRDVANLTGWIGDQTESALNWQIANAEDEPQDWLDAPLLYLAGDERVDLDEARLKRYLDLGGLLLAVNEGDRPDFARSIEDAGQRLCPGASWRKLDADHWVYDLLWTPRGRRPVVRALSNGVRELVVLIPAGDASAALQTGDEGDPAWTVAGNVYLYASEMNRPRPRLSRHGLARPAEARDGARPPVTIVHASHGGRWNPEPLALEVFAHAAPGDLDVRIVEHPLASIGDLDPAPALVVVNGLEAPSFTDAERAAIARYASRGVILFETPGGSGDFAAGAEAACADILGVGAAPLVHSRIVTGAGLEGAADLSRVEYRPYARETLGPDTTPRLRGITIGGVERVLLSRQDITFGLLDQPCWGVAGYAPATARDLFANIVRHAADLTSTPGPAAAP